MNRASAEVLPDNTGNDPTKQQVLVLGDETFTSITDKVCGIVERPKPPRAWYAALTVTSAMTLMLFAMLAHLILNGVGVWGVNSTVGWAGPS